MARTLSRSYLLQAKAELELRDRGCDEDQGDTPSFRAFIERVNPRYVFYPYAEVIVDALQRVADGELRRLMIFCPPRLGKSEIASRLFPAYYLLRYPERFFGMASYGADLAYGFSRNARAYYEAGGGTLAADASAVKFWATSEGGGLWAVGAGGPATGRGGHILSVDDPLKDAEQALSPKIRAKQQDWWTSTWSTREEPGGAMIVTLTRWHEDDLAGWLLAQEQATIDEGEEPERWHVISMEGLRTGDPPIFPTSCTTWEDTRAIGEPLCPERVPAAKMQRIKKQSAYWFAALYQQRPSPQEGGLWKRAWFEREDATFDVEPEGLGAVGFDWDTAYTADERNAACAYVKTGVDAEGNVYVLDLDFRWIEFPEQVTWMKALVGPHYIEAKATGKSAKQTLSRDGVVAVEVPVEGGDKEARTILVSPVAEAGKLRVKRSLLPRLLDDDRQGILTFPNSSHADLNDALVQAINRHTKKRHKPGFLSMKM